MGQCCSAGFPQEQFGVGHQERGSEEHGTVAPEVASGQQAALDASSGASAQTPSNSATEEPSAVTQPSTAGLADLQESQGLPVARGDDAWMQIAHTTSTPSCGPRQISFGLNSSSSDISTGSILSSGSARLFAQPDQSIIIFDWDDTLCPSSACKHQHELMPKGQAPEGTVLQMLGDHTAVTRAVLREAHTLASRVVVVTNADAGWVQDSCNSWMPELLPEIQRCQVVSARSIWEARGVKSPTAWKTLVFTDVLARFYSRYQSQSWKNVISIGDAIYEREALEQAVGMRPQQGKVAKRCRAKSVKFVEKPTIGQLTKELTFLQQALREIVEVDEDLCIDFKEELLTDVPSDGTPS